METSDEYFDVKAWTKQVKRLFDRVEQLEGKEFDGRIAFADLQCQVGKLEDAVFNTREITANLVSLQDRIEELELEAMELRKAESEPATLELQDVVGDHNYDEWWEEARRGTYFGIPAVSMSHNDLLVLVGYNAKRGRFPTRKDWM